MFPAEQEEVAQLAHESSVRRPVIPLIPVERMESRLCWHHIVPLDTGMVRLKETMEAKRMVVKKLNMVNLIQMVFLVAYHQYVTMQSQNYSFASPLMQVRRNNCRASCLQGVLAYNMNK